jgi:Raf kinase inhibitor-like YbhB/YbcL family protein
VNARILVVDDDTALAEMIGIVLRTEGFEPFFCEDGSAALDAFHSSKPDLVLLDLMLPGIDGIEVCARIREESGVPIIMLTAKSDTADVVKGLESGADDYVVKPFNPKELVARVRTRLRPTPDAPTGSGFWHWAVRNIPAGTTELPSGAGTEATLPDGAITSANEMRAEEYAGAAPPAGHGPHRYFFTLSALDVATIDIPDGATPAVLGFVMRGNVIARATLVGTAETPAD